MATFLRWPVQTTPATDLERYVVALTCVPGLGPVSIGRLLAEASDPQAAFARAIPDERNAAEALAEGEDVLRRCAARGVTVITRGAPSYPVMLLDLEDPPPVVFALGNVATVQRPCVALVGSRRATSYGKAVVRDFARQLAVRGVGVVSGMAVGIDAEAHAAALDAGGATVAVLGTGIDVPYPRIHGALHARIARDGLVLSEHPPGQAAHAGAFPRRNRIIAALVDVVVVIEAGFRSGALITAQLGGALARLVSAVPGPIDVESSKGTNQLLRDGAHVVASVEDVLALLALTSRGRDQVNAVAVPALATALDGPSFDALSPERRVLAVLRVGPQMADDLVRACRASPRDIGAALSTLQLKGAVDIDPSGLVRCTMIGGHSMARA